MLMSAWLVGVWADIGSGVTLSHTVCVLCDPSTYDRNQMKIVSPKLG